MTGGRGLFITLEGGEGAGKTTQIKLLSDFLYKQDYEVMVTREPGGTPEAEKIRNLLVQRDGGDWTPVAEVLLLFAARVMHVETLIKPALKGGKIVICDRFTDSTRAYQSYGHCLPRHIVEEINETALGGFKPDLTFILDLDVKTGLSRSGRRLAAEGSAEDRFEQLDISFHERLRQGFLEIAKQEPERCVVIDASGSVEKVAGEMKRSIKNRLKNSIKKERNAV